MIRFKPTDPEIAWRVAYPFEDGRHGISNPSLCHFGSSQKNVTSTTTSVPWTTQQPYLSSGFNFGQNLLNQPAPTQSNPVAPLNSTENTALSGITNLASNGTPITGAATDFATNLENGGYLNSNPALGYFGSLAGSNLGLSNPGATTLGNIAGSNPASSTPGNGVLSNIANTNVGSSAPGASTLGTLSGTNIGLNNPGASTLENYANGANLNGNGYSDPTAQSILSQVIPQVASEFNGGNSMNNPAAAYAAGQGATAALAPIEYQNYQTQEQLQQNAANTLGSNAISGANSQGTFASMLANLGLSGSQLSENAANALNSNSLTGTGIQAGAASNLNSGAISGGNLQATAAQGISQPYQQTLSNMVQGNALAPSDQALSYGDLQQLLQAGGTQQAQTQAQETGQAASQNFAQLSPYQQLQSYMQALGGNYGSSGTSTTPYFTNGASNIMSGVTGGANILGTLGNAVGGAATAGSTAAGLASLFAFL